jgi:hypothetical protein
MKTINFKKFFSLMIFLIFIFFIFSSVNGLETKGYLHSNDYYSVTYDAEGDAIVAAKLILYNTKNDDLSGINLEIPGNVVIYNLVQEYYGWEGSKRYYRNPPPVFYPIEYERDQTSSATLLKLFLPREIKTQKQGTILLLYKIPRGTVVDFLGVQKFDFKTIIDKNAILIQKIRVSINVQSDLYLKGGKAQVEYKPDYFAKVQSMETSEKGATSPELTDFSRRITYAKGLVKIAYNLDPYESLHVKGKFSDSWWKLYLLEILFVILVIVIILFTLKIAAWKKIKLLTFKSMLFNSKNKHYAAIIIRSSIFGFISAFFITVICSLFIFLFNWLSRAMPYYYGNLLMPLLLLLGLIIIIASLFGPVVLVGKTYGIVEGILTLVFTGFWLLVFIIILVIFSGFLFYKPPTPLIEAKPVYD